MIHIYLHLYEYIDNANLEKYMFPSHHIYIFTYLRPYTLTSCGYMESHFEFEFEFEFELRLRLRTHGSRP